MRHPRRVIVVDGATGEVIARSVQEPTPAPAPRRPRRADIVVDSRDRDPRLAAPHAPAPRRTAATSPTTPTVRTWRKKGARVRPCLRCGRPRWSSSPSDRFHPKCKPDGGAEHSISSDERAAMKNTQTAYYQELARIESQIGQRFTKPLPLSEAPHVHIEMPAPPPPYFMWLAKAIIFGGDGRDG